jgi:hypothetical protein
MRGGVYCASTRNRARIEVRMNPADSSHVRLPMTARIVFFAATFFVSLAALALAQ